MLSGFFDFQKPEMALKKAIKIKRALKKARISKSCFKKAELATLQPGLLHRKIKMIK